MFKNSDLRGGGQRSRPLPLPPLTSTLPPLVSLFLCRSSGRFPRANFSYFPFPRFLFTLFSPLSLLPPLLPLLPPPHPPSSYPVRPLMKKISRKCKKDYAGGRTPTDGRTTDKALINNDNSSFEHSAPVIALQIQKIQKKNYNESTK